MEKIILFYRFCSLADPGFVRLWQLELCRRLGLSGRVIVAASGINATLGGRLEDLRAYKREMNKTPLFRGIDYKWSDGGRRDFPRLSVKLRPELVTLAAGEDFDPLSPATALSPRRWHRYLEENPETLVLDARNRYESEIGYFDVPNLLRPDISRFRELKRVVAGLPREKPVLTYCTGDVRCEYLSAYMRSRGFKRVYHLDGGIMKYGRIFGDGGFWKGKCYVFDGRMKVGFSAESLDLAVCAGCAGKTSEQANCDDCNRQLAVCAACQKKPFGHCRSPAAAGRRR